MIKLLTLLTQLCTTSSAILVYMAHQWNTIGYGLNPWIALPVATLMMLLPHMVDHWFIETDEDGDLSCITLRNP